VDEPDGEDLSSELWDLELYARDYTRDELADLAERGLAYYDPAGDVWVVRGGPAGSFEIRNAEVPDANVDRYLPDAYATRFDGYTLETLNDLVDIGHATYDQDRGVWTVFGENGPYEVRDVDSPAQVSSGSVGPPPLEALIDRATIRYEAGQPAANGLEGIIFNALSAADASAGDGELTWRFRIPSWREDLLRQLDEAGVQAWYEISYARHETDRALGPIRVWDEEGARRVAERMSVIGEQADITLVASDGSRSAIGSYLDRQPLPDPGELIDSPMPYSELKAIATGQAEAPAHGPADEVPWPEPPPWPSGPIPTAAEVAGPPVPAPAVDPQATQLQFPQGISPLPVTATWGGPLRPTRLLYPDGTAVDFRPMGDSESVPAVAVGVVPADGDLAPGWLQVIRRGSGDPVAAHPALLSPRGVNPLGPWLSYRTVRRFGEFDGAEAAGRDSALVQAMFVELGDSIRTQAGEVREVTAVRALPHSDGGVVKVTIATTGPDGAASPLEYEGNHTVEVLIPAHHPVQDSPDAAHVFAMPQREPGPRAEFDDLDATLDWIRRGGTALRPPPSFGKGTPGQEPGPLAFGTDEASQQDGGTAGLPAGGTIPEQAGWQVSVRMTTNMHRAQSAAAAAMGDLAQSPAWLRLRRLTTAARRLAADARAGRLRFSDPAWALRSWRAVWVRVCEMTCDLAGKLMTDRLRGPAGRHKGSRPWQAARALHHTAAEGAAHAHGWLPRYVRLPMGSYEAIPNHAGAASARAKARVAARRYEETAGPAGQLEFPSGVAKAAGGASAGRQRAAVRGRHVRARPGAPRAG
jgi:hypothetical protein